MKQGLMDAIKGGVITFLICNIPLFIFGLLFNNQVLIINFDFNTITPYIYVGLPLLGAIIFFIGGRYKASKGGTNFLIGGDYDEMLVPLDGIWEDERFGANWKVTFGIPRGASLARVAPFVEGPFCPICSCKLDEITKTILFGWSKKKIWQCPDELCGFTQERPKAYLFKEEDAIAKVALRDYEESHK